MRIGLGPKLEYYFRAVCTHCDSTKPGTCKDAVSRKSYYHKVRGQGRPGGTCWAWALHAESLPVPHVRKDHQHADLSFPNRQLCRNRLESHPEFDDSIRCLERDGSPGPKPRADDPDSGEPWDLPMR